MCTREKGVRIKKERGRMRDRESGSQRKNNNKSGLLLRGHTSGSWAFPARLCLSASSETTRGSEDPNSA